MTSFKKKNTKKYNIIKKINKIAKFSTSLLIVEFKFISSNEINKLRKESRMLNINIFVSRNTLIKFLLQNTKFNINKNELCGSNLFVFSNDHPGTSIRLLNKYLKQDTNNLNIKLVFFKEKLLSKNKVNFFSQLPNYKEAIIILINTIKELCLGKLIRLLKIIKT